MASTQLTAVSGSTLEQLIDSIERQRKDIEFLLAHLDDDNILKLDGGKITLGNTSLEIWSDGIQTTVTGNSTDIGNMQTTITQQADQINLRATVSYVDNSLAPVTTDVSGLKLRVTSAETNITQNANQIELKASQSAVDTLTGRVTTAESSITQNANNIALKVSQTDYTGNTIASLINQSATTITLSAQKIDLLGITNVASEFQLGNAGDTDQKSIKFRGTSTWIYDDSLRFSITSDKQIDFWSSTGYVFNSLGPLKAKGFTGTNGIYFDGSSVSFLNSIVDFTGAYITGGYAKFG